MASFLDFLPLDLLSQAFNLPSIAIFLIFFNGYTLLYIFFSKRKEWGNWDSLDKLILSTISGIGLYIYFLGILYLIFGISGILSDVSINSPMLVYYNTILQAMILTFLWVQIINVKGNLLIFSKKMMKGFYIFSSYLFWLSVLFIPVLFAVIFSAYVILTGLMIYFITVGFMVSILPQLVFYPIVNKKLTLKNFLIEQIDVTRHATLTKPKKQFDIKKVTVVILISCFLVFSLFYYLLPDVSYGQKNINSFLVNYNNNQVGISVSLPTNPVSVYALEQESIYINRPSYYGWIPIGIDNLLVLSNNQDTLYGQLQSPQINLINNSLLYKSLPITFDNVSYVNGNNIVNIQSDYIPFSVSSNSSYINLIGAENLTSENIQANKVSVNEAYPPIVGNNITFFLNATNNFDKEVMINNFFLTSSYNYQNQIANCSFEVTVSGIRLHDNQSLNSKFICPRNNGCSSEGGNNNMYISLQKYNAIFVQYLRLEANSTALFKISTIC